MLAPDEGREDGVALDHPSHSGLLADGSGLSGPAAHSNAVHAADEMRTLRTFATLFVVGVLVALLATEAKGRRGGGGSSRVSWGSRSISTSRSSIRRREHNYEGSSRRRGGSPQDYDTNPLPSKTGGSSGQKSSTEVHVPAETDRVARKGGQSSIESGPAKETIVKNSRKLKNSDSATTALPASGKV